MLISERMEKELNEQLGRELAASNQYLNIAGYFDRESLPELSAFFARQSEEEHEHALKFFRYILDAGGHVRVPTIPAPPASFASAEAAVQQALEWELEVTRQIHRLVDMAREERDHSTEEFLRWFVEEQVEEVKTMDELLGVVRRAGPERLLDVEQYIARKRSGGAEPGP
ncbi:MAG: ferritin [Dehalococcoidia bacterium]|nr:ferritin [Dehalococcoidia bacterium]